MIACKTTIGFGAPTKAGTAKAHGEALGADELKGAKEKLGISLEPFSVPDDVLKSWREAGARGATARGEWEARFAALPARRGTEFDRRLRHGYRRRWRKRSGRTKALLETPQHRLTANRPESVIEAIVLAMSEFVAGSADLQWLQQQRRNPRSTSRPRRRKAASSITVSANTAWRRP